jgi:uncharacterized protein
LVSLERRIASLEDTELEVMEKLEEAQGILDRLAAQLAVTDDRIAALTSVRDEKAAGLTEDLRSVIARRGETVVGMPEDLIALYERIRGQSVVGAAPLRARQCGGCQMAINASEMAEITRAAPDQVIRCEECARILVRTSESGL